MKFFLNSNTSSWLRDLEVEFDESTNSIHPELIRLEEAGFLISEVSGKRKVYRANQKHPLFHDIHRLLLKHTGLDHIIEKVVHNLGGLSQAWLIGSFARGLDSNTIEILLVGDTIDKDYLDIMVSKAEKLIHHKINYAIISIPEKAPCLTQHPEAFLLWENAE